MAMSISHPGSWGILCETARLGETERTHIVKNQRPPSTYPEVFPGEDWSQVLGPPSPRKICATFPGFNRRLSRHFEPGALLSAQRESAVARELAARETQEASRGRCSKKGTQPRSAHSREAQIEDTQKCGSRSSRSQGGPTHLQSLGGGHVPQSCNRSPRKPAARLTRAAAEGRRMHAPARERTSRSGGWQQIRSAGDVHETAQACA